MPDLLQSERMSQTLPSSADTRLRVITDALPVGIAYVDQNKIYRFANDRFAAAYGLTPDEIMGKHADDFVSRDAMVLGDAFFEAAHSGKAVDFMHPTRHADGRLLTVRTFLRPDIATDGTVLGFYVCSINVTAQKEAEATRLQTQKMDAVGQLASGIAHDFNNLLGIILGNLIEVRERIVDESDRRELVEPSIRAAQHGARLTSQLLAMARRQPLNPQPICMEDCVEDCLRLLRRTLPPNVAIEFVRQEESRPAFLDRTQFETALLNLFLNARDAMPDGGSVRLLVDYPADPPADGAERAFVRIVVSDTGIGMNQDTASQAFEPFFTTKPPGKGTGLGLSMVYGFIRQSCGTISVDSTPGKGTAFTLLLPLATEGQKAVAAVVPTRRRQGLVLVVDDNADFRSTVRRQLLRAGYTVVEAEEGREALELLASIDGFQALVSDIAMPGLSGYQIAAEAAAIHRSLRIVLMTGFDGGEPVGSAGMGFPILRKPFGWTQLADAIEGGEVEAGDAAYT